MVRKKILVADDNAGIVDVMKMVFETEGFDVIATMNGNNILKLCEEKPDIIFLDVWMSGVDGNDICKQIKADGGFNHIPVIIFSASRKIKQIAIDCGADDFISKPFELKTLLSITHKYIARGETIQGVQ
jgi:two-component system alkaline phosphatase synthesis response regulator PhoP